MDCQEAWRARSPRWLEAHTAVREKHLRSHWVPGQHHNVLTGVLSNNYWELGRFCFGEGRYKVVWHDFPEHLRYHPAQSQELVLLVQLLSSIMGYCRYAISKARQRG